MLEKVIKRKIPGSCIYGVPKGIRTPVAAVKGQCPRPLDDGDYHSSLFWHLFWHLVLIWWSQAGSNRRPLHCQCSALPAELWPLESAGLYVTPHFLSSVCGHNPTPDPGGQEPFFYQLISGLHLSKVKQIRLSLQRAKAVQFYSFLYRIQ